MMRLQPLPFSLALASGILAIGTPAQTSPSVDQPGTPLLQVKIISSKETYAVNETILTKTIFINLSYKTLFFPEPVRQIHVPNKDTSSFRPKGVAVRNGNSFWTPSMAD